MRVLQAVAQALAASLTGIAVSQSLGAAGPLAIGAQSASVTAIGGAHFTASIGATATGTSTLATVALTGVTGLVSVGDTFTDGTNSAVILSQVSGTPGGAGTYDLVSAPTPGAWVAASLTSTSNVVDVTALGTNTAPILADGTSVVASADLTGTPTLTAQTGGTTGGIGTYTLSGAAQTVVSEAFTQANNLINVTAVGSGKLIIGAGLVGGTDVAVLSGFVSGTAGSTGVYTTSVYQQYTSATVVAYGSASVPAGPIGPVAYTPTHPTQLASGDFLGGLVGGSMINGVVLNPPRPVALHSGNNLSAVNFTITGIDRVGMPITETIAGPNNATVNTSRLFATVYTITASGAAAAVEAGWDGSSYSRWINLGNRRGNYSWKAIILATGITSGDVTLQTTSMPMNKFGGLSPGQSAYSATDDTGTTWTGGDLPDDIEDTAITLIANAGGSVYTDAYSADDSAPWAFVRIVVAAGTDKQVVLRVIPTRTA